MGDWYYIGHYGQLGPLTREQVDELIEGGVILRETYVWRTGMNDWLPADRVSELAEAFRAVEPFSAPPPPPGPRPFGAATAPTSAPPTAATRVAGGEIAPSMASYPRFSSVTSDRSRTLAGILQIIFPGIGRMYLGYAAYGVLQLILAVASCGLLAIWSIIDGIIILAGGLKMDGYGRQLND